MAAQVSGVGSAVDAVDKDSTTRYGYERPAKARVDAPEPAGAPMAMPLRWPTPGAGAPPGAEEGRVYSDMMCACISALDCGFRDGCWGLLVAAGGAGAGAGAHAVANREGSAGADRTLPTEAARLCWPAMAGCTLGEGTGSTGADAT